MFKKKECVAMLLAEKGYKTEKTVYTLEDATEEILKLCNREFA